MTFVAGFYVYLLIWGDTMAYMNEDVFFNLLKSKIKTVHAGGIIELDIRKHKVYDVFYNERKLTLTCNKIVILEVCKGQISLNVTKIDKRMTRLQNRLKALVKIDRTWENDQLSFM